MTFGDIDSRLAARLGEFSTIEYYERSERLVAVNAVQRLFVLLTLCLERTATLSVGTTTPFYHMLEHFSDWLLPLRVRIVGGGKVKPSRLEDLAALDTSWRTATGQTARYAHVGFDLLALYKMAEISLSITFARCPAVLSANTDTPEIPAEYHMGLIDGAIPLLRAKEGAQEFQKVMPLWDRYLDGATKLGDYVRARNRTQGYDRMPFELERFDRSVLLEGAAK